MSKISRAEMIEMIEECCGDKFLCEGCPLQNDDTSVCSTKQWCDATDEELEDALKRLSLDDGEKHYDPVNNPIHYTQGSVECIDSMISAFGKDAVAEFCLCNSFKYLFRTKHKNGLEDIEKAQWYLDKYIELKYSNSESDAS